MICIILMLVIIVTVIVIVIVSCYDYNLMPLSLPFAIHGYTK